MGYYSNFNIDGNSVDIIEDIKKISDYEGCWAGTELRDATWRKHDSDMKEISLGYPDMVLFLSGEGEESGDIWKSYYKNGKCQTETAKLMFEPFDESKLK